MIDAMWAGLAADEKVREARAAIEGRATQLYEPLLRSGRIILIGELEGKTAAHTLVEIGHQNADTGATEAEHVDTYVLEPYRRLGIARTMTAIAEHKCHELAVRRLTGNVSLVPGTATEETRTALLRAGWWEDKLLLRKRLPTVSE